MLNLTPEGDCTLDLSEVESLTIKTGEVVRLLPPFNLISKAISCYLNLFAEVEIKNMQISSSLDILSIYSNCVSTKDADDGEILSVEGGQCIPILPYTWNDVVFVNGIKKSSLEFKSWFNTECPLCVRNVAGNTSFTMAIKMTLVFKGLQPGIGIPYQRQNDYEELALLQRANIMKAFNQARQNEKELEDTEKFLKKEKFRKNAIKKKI